MKKGNRYRYVGSDPGRVGDYVQFGYAPGDEFDPDLVEYVWAGKAGVAVFMDGCIRWPDGEFSSETTYDPLVPAATITIERGGFRTVWELEGDASRPASYEPVEDLVVISDSARRVVTVTMRNLRLTMSPEAAEKLASRIRYHADQAKGR